MTRLAFTLLYMDDEKTYYSEKKIYKIITTDKTEIMQHVIKLQ